MASPHPKQMIVEGRDDLYAIAQLLGHHIDWPNGRGNEPLDIRDGKSVDEILDRDSLSLMFKQSGLECLSVVLDADTDHEARWARLRPLIAPMCENLPEVLPAEGLITVCPSGLRFGVWIMPDNMSAGMLETFLTYLIPDDGAACWGYTQEVVDGGPARGSAYREVHKDKARIHTWLALQDPPGERFGNAVVKRILDPHSERCQPFIKWCRELYRF